MTVIEPPEESAEEEGEPDDEIREALAIPPEEEGESQGMVEEPAPEEDE